MQQTARLDAKGRHRIHALGQNFKPSTLYRPLAAHAAADAQSS
jgi:hypothetical protein